MPSMARPAGSGVPVMAAMVGSSSIVEARASHVVPAGMRPGGVLGRIQTGGRSGKDYTLVHAPPFRIGAGEPAPFLGKAVEVRCADGGGTEVPEIAVALVVGEVDDDVRLRWI